MCKIIVYTKDFRDGPLFFILYELIISTSSQIQIPIQTDTTFTLYIFIFSCIMVHSSYKER